MVKTISRLCLPLVVLLPIILACDDWADIKGGVVDPYGKPVAGIKISLQQGGSTVQHAEGNGVSGVRDYYTNEHGRFDVFDNLCPMPVGCSSDISITLSKPGYRTVTEYFDQAKDRDFMHSGKIMIVIEKE